MDDHDPFNEPELAHSRARELMPDEFFWDCTDEWAPFGSDEGATAYYEWRSWRSENPSRPIVDCFSWILEGRLDEFNEALHSDEQITKDLKNPDEAFMADSYDMFTLDTTIIGTGFGQLMDEGKIDPDAKRYIAISIERQLNDQVCEDEERREILLALKRALDVA